jgi:hypothetical protein
MNGIRRYYVIKLKKPIEFQEEQEPIISKKKDNKTHWDCMKCDGHGVIIRNNELVNCDVCGSEF